MAVLVVEMGAIQVFQDVNTPTMIRIRYRQRLVSGAHELTDASWDDDSVVIKARSVDHAVHLLSWQW